MKIVIDKNSKENTMNIPMGSNNNGEYRPQPMSTNVKISRELKKRAGSNKNYNRYTHSRQAQQKPQMDTVSMSSVSSYASSAGSQESSQIEDIANPMKKMKSDQVSISSRGSSSSICSKNSSRSIRSNHSNRSVQSRASTVVVEEMKDQDIDKINREKQELLYKFHRLEQKGIYTIRKFNMKSSLEDMKIEYNKLTRQVNVEHSIKFQRRVLLAVASGAEFLNKRYDPFNIKLDGWSENIMENISDFDNVFERLGDKYSGSGEMSPEIELLFLLLSSGFMFHLTQTLFKTALPNMTDIAKENPNLMQNLANAMMQNMSQKNASANPRSATQAPEVQEVHANNHMGPPPPVDTRNEPRQSGISGALPPHMQPFDGVISTMMSNGVQNFMSPPEVQNNDSIPSDYEDVSSLSSEESEYSEELRSVPVVEKVTQGRGKGGRGRGRGRGKGKQTNEVTLNV